MTKVHVGVNGTGRLIRGRPSAGQVHNITQVGALMIGVLAKCVGADKDHCAVALPEQNAAMSAKMDITRHANQPKPIGRSKAVCKHRNPIDQFVWRIHCFSRIATRHQELAERAASFVCLVGAIVCAARMPTNPGRPGHAAHSSG